MDKITLEKLLRLLCEAAVEMKVVNHAISSLSEYTVNSINVEDYALMMIVPSGQHQWHENTTTYSLDVFCIDRLLDDASNDISVESLSIEILKDYIQKLREYEWVVNIPYDIYFQNFTETEKTSDRCGGALCRLNIEVMNNNKCYID